MRGGNGVVVTVRHGERITELFVAGRLAERSFARTSGEPAGVVHIYYEWSDAAWALLDRAVLNNHWFGYRLTITTNRETRINTGETQ